MYARRAEIEMLIAFFSTASMLCFLDFVMSPDKRRSLYQSYFFLGLAFLTKGPVALVFFIPPLAAFYVIRRDGNILAGLVSGWGWLIFACVALPWYVYCLAHVKGSLLGSIVEKDIAGKIAGSAKHDPFFEYFVAIAANFLPWIAVLLYRARTYIKGVFNNYETGFFACWLLAPLLVLSCFGEKHIKYILPVFPAFAVLLGNRVVSACSELTAQGNRKVQRYTVVAAAMLLIIWSIYYAAIESRLYSHRFSAIAPMMHKIEQLQTKAPIYSYDYDYPTLVYYFGKPIPVVTRNAIETMFAGNESFLLIADDRTWNELEDSRLCLLDEYQPFLHRERQARIFGSSDVCTRKAK
jgi:4-amino-4-deoxy-L-arabinose transferase-like glycosyltransferase